MIQSVHTCNTDELTQDSRTTELEDVCNKGFEMNEGHFVHSLDMALASTNAHWKAYYGGTFIGNHLHKCVKVGNYISHSDATDQNFIDLSPELENINTLALHP